MLTALTNKLQAVLQNGPGDGDPRTKDLFLMGSFSYILSILLVYNLFIYVIGPKFMEAYKEPWDTYGYLVWHNFFLVTTNALLGTGLFILLIHTKQNLLCQPVGKGHFDDTIAYLLYGLLLLKIFELIDAITLVCKKIEPPFILVFHHTTIVAMVWVSVKYGPGGSAIFPTLLNSWVHVLIYMHFKFTRHYMSQHQSRRTFIMIYFIQFLIVTALSVTTIYFGCGYPEWVAVLSVAYNAILIVVYSRSMWTLWCCAPPPGSGSSPVADENDSSSDDCSDDDGPKTSLSAYIINKGNDLFDAIEVDPHKKDEEQKKHQNDKVNDLHDDPVSEGKSDTKTKID